MTKDFLIEIGTEELPAVRLKSLMIAFADSVERALSVAQLSHGDIHAYAAPRRLALVIEQLAAKQPDQTIERRGPAIKAAYDSSGAPTKACLGFIKSCGISLEKLETIKTDKGEWLYCCQTQAGQTVQQLMPEIINTALQQLPVGKSMRWGNGSVEFIRPVHWAVMLFGDELIPAKIVGVKTGRDTFGHRFHHPQAITLKKPADYAKKLREKGWVIADFMQRRDLIRQQLDDLAKTVNATVIVDEALWDEVTGLVEWPVALLANFSKQFLQMPKEVLMTSLKFHQKCFSLVDGQGEMLANFITISHIDSHDPQQVIKGNERVVQARLSDAEFFYQADLKTPLAERVEQLKKVSFQHELGSVFDKTLRIQKLAVTIGQALKVNSEQVSRAAYLAKADLVTDMVGEFPGLQGVMGKYYAQHDNEAAEVALALEAYYYPHCAGDRLPDSPVACVVAIADRLDTLVGIFGINQIPTGEKDPFGLRRAAIAVLRIVIEKQLPVDLEGLLEHAVNHYQQPLKNNLVVEQVLDYIFERLRAWYHERNISVEIFNAVLAKRPTQPLDFHHRIAAVSHFCQLPAAQALAAANKRVSNILTKQGGDHIPADVDLSLLAEPAEKTLQAEIDEKTRQLVPLLKDKNYQEMLVILSSLRSPVDQFFDDVMVMVEDANLRNNRLALLAKLRGLFLQVADISLLPV